MTNKEQRLDPRRMVRWARMVLLGCTMVLLYLIVSRYRTWSMNEANDCMLPAYRPGAHLLVDLKPRPPRRKDVVIYRYKGKGRIARVAALGGDRMEVRDGILYVNGKRTVHRIPKGAKVPARVPPGELFLLNDNPRSRLPDSLDHGPVPAGRIWARVLLLLDFL